MWKQVVQGEWPVWALDLHHVWRHDKGHWLTGQTNRGSTLWELRVPDGTVYINQLDLPFNEDLGVPLAWASRELLEEMPHRKEVPHAT